MYPAFIWITFIILVGLGIWWIWIWGSQDLIGWNYECKSYYDSGCWRPESLLFSGTRIISANTKHLYNICTMLDQRRRRWADVVQMLYKCFVFDGMLLQSNKYEMWTQCWSNAWPPSPAVDQQISIIGSACRINFTVKTFSLYPPFLHLLLPHYISAFWLL